MIDSISHMTREFRRNLGYRDIIVFFNYQPAFPKAEFMALGCMKSPVLIFYQLQISHLTKGKVTSHLFFFPSLSLVLEKLAEKPMQFSKSSLLS